MARNRLQPGSSRHFPLCASLKPVAVVADRGRRLNRHLFPHSLHFPLFTYHHSRFTLPPLAVALAEAAPCSPITIQLLFPSNFSSRSVSNSIVLLQCASFIAKSGLTTGGSLPRPSCPSFPSLMVPFASRKIHLPLLAPRHPHSGVKASRSFTQQLRLRGSLRRTFCQIVSQLCF